MRSQRDPFDVRGITVLLFAALTILGCDRDDQIVSYQAPKEPPRAVAESPKPPAPANAAPPTTTQAPANDAGIKWTLPPGWVEQPPKPMRVASFKTSSDPTAAEVIVTRFGVNSYGGLLANINRWRGMVELPPIDDEKQQPVEHTNLKGGAADAYEFSNNDKKLVVFMIPRDQTVWFIRFMGPAKEVDAQKKNFESFLGSIEW